MSLPLLCWITPLAFHAGHFTPLLATDPLLFAFRESTLPGKLILLFLFVSSIFSWSVMVTKIRVLQFARRRTEAFLEQFRADRLPLRMYESGDTYDGAPIYEVYYAGCQEMTFHLLGSTEVDETFHSRLELADKVTPAQLRAVSAVMERAVGEEALRLESQLILLSTAVSGAPFLGLLGTVWGVMDTFTGVAEAGKANLAAMAPGVSGALITTVIALLVAIPAMFGYNFILTSIRSLIVQMDNFSSELESEFEHKYVSHGPNWTTRLAIFRTSFDMRRRFSQREGMHTLSEINVTPMLDLCFVLLVIFMITTPLLENSTELALPTGAPGGREVDPDKVQTLSIDRGEIIKLNGETVALAQLTARLTALRVKRPDLAVIIRSHKDLTVQKLIGLMDCLKTAQITKVGIATQPADGEFPAP